MGPRLTTYQVSNQTNPLTLWVGPVSYYQPPRRLVDRSYWEQPPPQYTLNGSVMVPAGKEVSLTLGDRFPNKWAIQNPDHPGQYYMYSVPEEYVPDSYHVALIVRLTPGPCAIQTHPYDIKIFKDGKEPVILEIEESLFTLQNDTFQRAGSICTVRSSLAYSGVSNPATVTSVAPGRIEAVSGAKMTPWKVSGVALYDSSGQYQFRPQ